MASVLGSLFCFASLHLLCKLCSFRNNREG
uniref:Uncharacterized protein n=1 Tax=Arundo donax TaxID=35708 RepID=A0A0A8Y9A3_ARUDO